MLDRVFRCMDEDLLLESEDAVSSEAREFYIFKIRPVVFSIRERLEVMLQRDMDPNIKKEAGASENTQLFVSTMACNLKDTLEDLHTVLKTNPTKQDLAESLNILKDYKLVSENKNVWVYTFEEDVGEKISKLQQVWTNHTKTTGQRIISLARVPYTEYITEFPMLDFRKTDKTTKIIKNVVYNLCSTQKLQITVDRARPILMEKSFKAPSPTRNIPLFNEYLKQHKIGYLEFYLVYQDGTRPEKGEERDKLNKVLSTACAVIIRKRFEIPGRYRNSLYTSTPKCCPAVYGLNDDVWMLSTIKHAFCTQGDHCMCTLEGEVEQEGERDEIVKTVMSHLPPNTYKLEFIQPPRYPTGCNGECDTEYDLDTKLVDDWAMDPKISDDIINKMSESDKRTFYKALENMKLSGE